MSSPTPLAQLWMPPLIATASVGACCVVIATLLSAGPGAVGAVIGLASVVTFFSISLLVMAATARWEPLAVMSIALVTYGVKIFAFGLLLVLLFEQQWLDGDALALTIIVGAGVWIAAQVFAFRRARLPVFDVLLEHEKEPRGVQRHEGDKAV